MQADAMYAMYAWLVKKSGLQLDPLLSVNCVERWGENGFIGSQSEGSLLSWDVMYVYVEMRCTTLLRNIGALFTCMTFAVGQLGPVAQPDGLWGQRSLGRSHLILEHRSDHGYTDRRGV